MSRGRRKAAWSDNIDGDRGIFFKTLRKNRITLVPGEINAWATVIVVGLVKHGNIRPDSMAVYKITVATTIGSCVFDFNMAIVA